MPRTEIPGKFTPERNAIAVQLREFRRVDSTSGQTRYIVYKDASRLAEYLWSLGGLEKFINYLRSLKSSNLLIDIGAGNGNAISQLEKNALGQDLEIKATTLAMRRKSLDPLKLGRENTFFTSVERFDGVEDESVAGLIAVSSVEYSASPDLAVKSIDRVLVPGGAFKVTFLTTDSIPSTEKSMDIRDYKYGSDFFTDAFLKLGYDVAFGGQQYLSVPVILLAIKPGGRGSISAGDLLIGDNGMEDVRKYIKR